ncbi:MAG: hypothetical protein HYS56_03705 [Candidatus Omnitrophica bacterium]|nr:hypothetical protein [Candidatus Omnitrophota bacterium]
MSNPVLIFAATRWEVSPEIYQLPNTAVILTGMGMDNAYHVGAHCNVPLHGERTVPLPGQSLFLSIGFSGSTHESLRPYDIVLANAAYPITYSKRWETKKEFKFPEWNLSLYHNTPFEKSRVVWGRIGTVPRVIWLTRTKKILGNAGGVCAVDMESCAVARAAQERYLPFLAIRIILDSIDEPLIGWRPWEFPSRVFKARKILGRFVSRNISHIVS